MMDRSPGRPSRVDGKRGKITSYKADILVPNCGGDPIVPSQYIPTTSDVGAWITVVETASDGRGNVGSAIADPVGPVTLDLVTATMQWTFYYTPPYTKVTALSIDGLSAQATVRVGCRGRGCPFSRHVSPSGAGRRCGLAREPNCPPPGSLDLSQSFSGYRLHAGTQITVAITIPGGVGKFYAFTIRAGRGPHVSIGCLGPGATHPGHAC